ncbi:hypothetical protein RJ639_020860 [Escallonia herrerae]|uniref:Plastocyanin-like domain-containing protein n=1 Tax=Escallonia herrerae TaxID=1293975 RepID=A0AA88V4V0_9ASTE|nr:hypothetical protein RJ639_020860 [Escallonia herrerae]
MDILQAYYRRLKGVYDTDFPREPPYVFNYTADVVQDDYLTPEINGTKVLVLKHNSSVEIVFQGTNVLASAENHPMHLHGFNFYMVGSDFGNFDNETDPKSYNFVDPPEMNTVGIQKNGWAAIRFTADNPEVIKVKQHLCMFTLDGKRIDVFTLDNLPLDNKKLTSARNRAIPI